MHAQGFERLFLRVAKPGFPNPTADAQMHVALLCTRALVDAHHQLFAVLCFFNGAQQHRGIGYFSKGIFRRQDPVVVGAHGKRPQRLAEFHARRLCSGKVIAFVAENTEGVAVAPKVKLILVAVRQKAEARRVQPRQAQCVGSGVIPAVFAVAQDRNAVVFAADIRPILCGDFIQLRRIRAAADEAEP